MYNADSVKISPRNLELYNVPNLARFMRHGVFV